MRQQKNREIRSLEGVSIHAPRVGCDLYEVVLNLRKEFQFTHPVWGATIASARSVRSVDRFQFTHPVWGATLNDALGTELTNQFQFTHPVWGATHHLGRLPAEVVKFQFTHPVWGATLVSLSATYRIGVSIHAPRVGCDLLISVPWVTKRLFQFTHPVWGATLVPRSLVSCWLVSIHAPRVGCDLADSFKSLAGI